MSSPGSEVEFLSEVFRDVPKYVQRKEDTKGKRNDIVENNRGLLTCMSSQRTLRASCCTHTCARLPDTVTGKQIFGRNK